MSTPRPRERASAPSQTPNTSEHCFGHRSSWSQEKNKKSMANEVEIKFAVPDLKEIRRKLRSQHFREITPRTDEMNTLYDRPLRPLRRRGEILRIRKFGESWKLTHKAKGKDGRHKTRN